MLRERHERRSRLRELRRPRRMSDLASPNRAAGAATSFLSGWSAPGFRLLSLQDMILQNRHPLLEFLESCGAGCVESEHLFFRVQVVKVEKSPLLAQRAREKWGTRRIFDRSSLRRLRPRRRALPGWTAGGGCPHKFFFFFFFAFRSLSCPYTCF